MTATLLIAAHGTKSDEGAATTRALVEAVAAQRPSVPVELCFLDVASPSLADALDTLASVDVVVVPLLLSGGYHVKTDIPAIVAGRQRVTVAGHLGPDPAIIAAVADRLTEAGAALPATTVLAAISSSYPSARQEVETAADRLGRLLGRPVSVLPLIGDVPAAINDLPAPVAVAAYLLAPGGFITTLRAAVDGRSWLADPIGVHPGLVSLVWSRYDAALLPAKAPDQVR